MHVDWPLIINYLKNACSDEERNHVEEWLRSHPDNQTFFEQLAEIWKAAGVTYDNFQPDQHMAWEKIAKRLNGNKIPLSRPGKNYKIFFSWAAGFLILIGIGVLCMFMLIHPKNSSGEDQQVVIFTTDSCKRMILSDRSKVWLNKNSRLTYNNSFNLKERAVTLTGEAYFEITPNTLKPFVIQISGATAKVVGTTFNLKTDTIEKKVILNVISGIVKFSSIASPQKGMLVYKNEQAIFNQLTDSIIKTAHRCTNEITWKTGDFIFENERLSDVCHMLSDYYHVSIRVADSSLADIRLSAGYNRQPLRAIIQAIGATLDLKIDSIDKQLIFKH